MKIFSLFILLLLCITLAEKANDEAIKKSFFFGRSADIILRPKNYLPNDDSVLITINDKGTISDPIADIDIAYSLWAPSHGIDSADQNLPTNVLNDHDLFSKTKLNLLFTVDNLGKDILKKFPTLKLMGGEQRTVLQTAYAQDSVSLLTSVISGREPRTHGIIGSKWQSKTGHLISAFKSSNTMSLVNNYPDLLSKLFVGRSLVFGASADFQIASTLSAHPALYADHPFWNDFGFYYDPSLESFESLYPFAVFEPDLMLNKAAILSANWEKTIGAIKIKCDKGDKFEIEVVDKEIYASYKTDSADEISLLAEIKFLLTTVEVMGSRENWMKLIADDSPDYIAFGFASLGKIKDMYGEKSDKFRAALYAVDALIEYATNAFDKMYAGSVHAHAIFLNPTRVTFPGKISQIVSSSLSAHLLNPALMHLPSVYVSRNAPLKQVCNSLTIELEAEDVDVICPSLELNLANNEEEFRPYEFVVDPHANLKSNGTITYMDVFVFQIMFWFAIAIALALVFSSLAVFAIDIPATSNLIRQMPNLFHDPHNQRNLW